MAKISTGYTFGLTTKQAQVARLMAEGRTHDEIILVVFGAPIGEDGTPRAMTPAEKGQATKTLRKWARLPGFGDCYRSIVREMAFPAYGSAVQRITAQVNHANPWVAQGAAREVLTRFGPVIMGDDDREIVVRVEGMPMLGMPSGEPATPDDERTQ